MFCSFVELGFTIKFYYNLVVYVYGFYIMVSKNDVIIESVGDINDNLVYDASVDMVTNNSNVGNIHLLDVINNC
jgi:hypothetical protein